MIDEDVIDLMDLFEIVKKHILLFILICSVCVTVAYGYMSFFVADTFEATSTIIIVQNKDNSNTNALTYNDVQLSQKQATTYKSIMMSEAISDDVISNLDLYSLYGINTQKYRNMVSISAESNTEVMNVAVKANDPKLAADISNEIVSVFKSKIFDIMSVDNVTVLNTAKVPERKSGPSTMKYAGIGAMIGAVICAVITMIIYFTDTKIKSEEDVKKIFDYPIIGNIPFFEVKSVIGEEVKENA